MIEEIIAALMLSHPHDIQTIKRYVAWVQFRRNIHTQFYTSAHWVKSSRRHHWVGNSS